MPKSYLIDKDGVIVSGSRLIPGADAFIGRLNAKGCKFLILTNSEHSENTAMIGDRMDTDVVMGIETGMETILVLSGVTRREEIERMPYRPSQVVDSVAELER